MTSATLSSATSAGADWTAEARDRDANDVVVPASDTLQLYFRDVPPLIGQRREWFLSLDGMPVSALTAAFLAMRAHVDDAQATPTRFALYQNIPNPLSGATVIAFDLPVASDVRLELFDAQGRLVRRFVSHEEAGRHRVDWNLRGGRGADVSPGIYTYRLRAGSFEARRKLVVLP